MSIIAENNGIKRELVPSGNHVARCYSMIQIGTIEKKYLNEMKKVHQVRITWELPNEMRVFDESIGEQPMAISKNYTLSMHEKANLRKDLESWRGKRFSEEEAKRFDITKLLGIPCMLNVIHGVNESSGNEYASIAGITALPKGMIAPEPINSTFELSYQMWSWEKYNSLPEFIQSLIASSDEFKRISDPVNQDVQDEDNETDGLPF